MEPRKSLWISLHTDSLSEAELKASVIWAEQTAAWEAKLAGDTTDAEKRFEAARELATAKGARQRGSGSANR
ncbi:hypothetical protein [Thioclava sp. GXIMD4216]|uniref:hypothetical protein n=1 Tax=Thioclava sp. GXIMD4216 TaxID=3131929 RepID=UPI0030CC083A